MFTSPIATRDALSLRGNVLPSGTPTLGTFLGANPSNGTLAYAGVVLVGLASARPGTSSGCSGRLYYATDTGELSYDQGGTGWTTLGPKTRHASALGVGTALGTSMGDLISTGSITLEAAKDLWVFGAVQFTHDSNIGRVEAQVIDEGAVVIAQGGTTGGTSATGMGYLTIFGKVTKTAGTPSFKLQARRVENAAGSATASSTNTKLLILG